MRRGFVLNLVKDVAMAALVGFAVQTLRQKMGSMRPTWQGWQPLGIACFLLISTFWTREVGDAMTFYDWWDDHLKQDCVFDAEFWDYEKGLCKEAWNAALKSLWRPIETAPKDGTEIDTWSPLDGRIPWVYWEDDEWISKILQWHGNPTHWMPLPEPPKADEVGEG